MKASELIELLKDAVYEFGDLDVFPVEGIDAEFPIEKLEVIPNRYIVLG